jgi:hypothetical protein
MKTKKKSNDRLLHFSELTKRQVTLMYARAIQACIEYSKEIGMSGLSGLPSHNIYNAIEKAIFNEWEQAKKIMKKPRVRNAK